MSKKFLNQDLFLNSDLFSLRINYGEVRDGFGQALLELGEIDKRVVALSADLSASTRTDLFAKKYPQRFFQIGVAEQNLATVAAGLAAMGKIPFMASFATFSPGRNWEQIRTTICLNQQNVKIAGFHAGVATGADGSTHQALEDLALMRVLPRMTVISPCDQEEAFKATLASAKLKSPVYLRFFREKSPIITTTQSRFVIGRANLLWKTDQAVATIIATGITVYQALLAARNLWEKDKIKVNVFNFHTIKPLDKEALNYAQQTGAVIVAEDHQQSGGLGGAIAEYYSSTEPTLMEFVGLKDQFGQSGPASQLLEYYELDQAGIIEAVKRALKRKKN